jgi:hypothetical protein
MGVTPITFMDYGDFIIQKWPLSLCRSVEGNVALRHGIIYSASCSPVADRRRLGSQNSMYGLLNFHHET